VAELDCTCGDGGQSTGNKQEIIEKRMSGSYGLTVQEIHYLLDLMVDVLEVVIDLAEVEPGETERRMAKASGRPVEWIEGFLADWEAISDELDGIEWWKLPECSTPAPDCS
jgi:hypothetical protein